MAVTAERFIVALYESLSIARDDLMIEALKTDLAHRIVSKLIDGGFILFSHGVKDGDYRLTAELWVLRNEEER